MDFMFRESVGAASGDRIISHRVRDTFAVEIAGKQYFVARERRANGIGGEEWRVEVVVRGGYDKEIVNYRTCDPEQKTHKRVVAWVKAQLEAKS